MCDMHRMLFGGAIFAAGVAAQASAADKPLPFANSDSFFSIARSYDYGLSPLGYDGQVSYDPANPEVASAVVRFFVAYQGFGFATSGVSNYAVSASAYSFTVDDRMTARTGTIVEFTEPTRVRMQWDVLSNGACGVFELPALDLVAGPGIFDATAIEQGDIVEVVQPGLYQLFVEADANQIYDDWAMITLPSDCDLDANGALNIDDVDAFVVAFLAGDLIVDFDGNGALNVDDVDAFVACFLAG